MAFDFRQLAEIEAQTRRILGGVRTICPEYRSDNIEFILTEVRYAGQTLCKPDVTPEEYGIAADRLLTRIFGPYPRT